MKNRIITHQTRFILLTIAFFFLFILFLTITIVKLSNPYKVSIYNYESYLSKNIINKVKKNYSYHIFKNLDEFTRAIKNKRAVAGVHSDYQIAQLILEGELKKINFKKVYNIDYNEENKKQKIFSLYTDEVKHQFELFDKWIINEIKRINPNNLDGKPNIIYDQNKQVIGFDIDGDKKGDSFYEYLIPYFTLDKMIVYNPENSNIASKTRNNLKQGVNFDDIKDGESWLDTIKKLVSKYKKPRVYWTNWFLDNAMIGQFYKHDKENNQKINNEWVLVNNKNYKNILDSFNNFVIESTNASIKNILRNKLVTDGQELVSSIIEPEKGKADIAIMYNGDALDAYYGKDNFESLPDNNNVNLIRPKDNYMNIDAWIISKDTNDKEADLFLESLNQYLYKDINKSESELLTRYLNNVYNDLLVKDTSLKDQYLSNLFNNKDITKPKEAAQINTEFFTKNYENFKNAWDNENLPYIMNFHNINYSITFKNVKSFLKKWYFLNNKKEVDKKALTIFDFKEIDKDKKINFRPYQPLDLELKTKMIEYYYQITNS